MSRRIKSSKIFFFSASISLAFVLISVAARAQVPSGDRAVEISKRARASVNRSGKQLVSSSKAFFKAFAAYGDLF